MDLDRDLCGLVLVGTDLEDKRVVLDRDGTLCTIDGQCCIGRIFAEPNNRAF